MRSLLVHASIICARSKFFQTAMNGRWLESDERSIKFEEDGPEIFSLYVHLLYKNWLPIMDESNTKGDHIEFVVLAKLFVLAEKLMDVTSKNIILSSMISKRRHKRENATGRAYLVPRLDAVKLLYDGTPVQSPARKLMVDFYTEIGAKGDAGKTLSDSKVDIPRDFLFDLAVTSMNRGIGRQEKSIILL